MSDDLPPLGDSGINLPYESNPEPVETEIRALQCGGLVVLAATTEVRGSGVYPAVIFRFVTPDGKFAPDIMLTASPAELKALVPLLEKTVAGAVKGAHRARGGGQ